MRILGTIGAAAFLILGLLVWSGCQGMQSVTELGTAIATSSGVITTNEAQSINRTAAAWSKAMEQVTPEQEYYIGRSVAATILEKYKPYTGEEVTSYLNLLGQTLAAASDRPESFGGYHFLALDSEEINAFAAPGGLILVTKGMLRCCPSEDALAAVLAHEISHAAHRDGLRSIEADRLRVALAVTAVEGGKSLGTQQLGETVKAFEGSIMDVSATLLNNGYSRSLERQADQSAVKLLARVGYDPEGLVTMLTQMEKRLKPGGLDFAKTHPDPNDRLRDVRAAMGGAKAAPGSPVRQERFRRALSKILAP